MSVGMDDDNDEEYDWETAATAHDNKSMYATSVQDEEMDEDEDENERIADAQTATISGGLRAMTAADVASSFKTAGRGLTGTAAKEQPAQPSSHSSSQSCAQRQQAGYDVNSVAINDGESDEDELSDVDDDEDEDDDIGGDADRLFQDELARMQPVPMNGDSSSGASEDLLTRILREKASARGSERRDGGSEHDVEDRHSSMHTIGGVSEGEVDYQIYPDFCIDVGSAASANMDTISQRLAALRTATLHYLSAYTCEYIWQKEPFSLQICAPNLHRPASGASDTQDISSMPMLFTHPSDVDASSSTIHQSSSAFSRQFTSHHSTHIPHLHGNTYFTDNGEDEWFIVYLLLTLSAHYPDLSICLSDSDGSFLCIELSNVLPDSIRPETSQHRAWLRGGRVHILPMPDSPANIHLLPAKPTIQQALTIINKQTVCTAARPEVQQALLAKLAPYTAAASSPTHRFHLASPSLSSFHHARVLLPLPLALILHRYPQLIAEFVHNFFYRDPIDMKRANKMERWMGNRETTRKHQANTQTHTQASPDAAIHPSSESDVPFVFTRLRFTHCLYAQLLHQRFGAPRCLSSAIGTALSAASLSIQSSHVARAVDLGTKLTAGAEMWYHNQTMKIAKKRKIYETARDKLAHNAPILVVHNNIINMARQVEKMELKSNADVEAFLSTASQAFPASPSLTPLSHWRAFLAEIDNRRLASFFSSTPGTSSSAPVSTSPSSSTIYWRHLVKSFLLTVYWPHHCVDHEAADELHINPDHIHAFDWSRDGDGEEWRTVEHAANIPSYQRILSEIGVVCDAVQHHLPSTPDLALPPPTTSLPGSLREVWTTLVRGTFHSFPDDDSDSWLHLSASDLDRMMMDASGGNSMGGVGDISGMGMDMGMDGAGIVDTINQFVNKVSDIEGVEPPTAKEDGGRTQTTTSEKHATFIDESKTGSAVSSTSTTHPTFDAVSIDESELHRLLSSVDADVHSWSGLSDAQLAAFTPRPIVSINAAPTQYPSTAHPIASSHTNVHARFDSTTTATTTIAPPSTPGELEPTRENTRPPPNDPFARSAHAMQKETTRRSQLQTEGDLHVHTPQSNRPDHATAAQPMSRQKAESKRSESDQSNAPAIKHRSTGTAATSDPHTTALSSMSGDSEKLRLSDYMDAMDDELSKHGLHSSFAGHNEGSPPGTTSSSSPSTSIPSAVNIDANLLSNLLESYDSEHHEGLTHPGPVTSIMASMNLTLPTNADRDESTRTLARSQATDADRNLNQMGKQELARAKHVE